MFKALIILMLISTFDLFPSEIKSKKLQNFYPNDDKPFKGFIIKSDSNSLLIWKNKDEIQNYGRTEILKIEDTNDSILIAENEIIPIPEKKESESNLVFINSLQYSLGFNNVLSSNENIRNAYIPIFVKSTFLFEQFELMFRMYYGFEYSDTTIKFSNRYQNLNVATLFGKHLEGKYYDFDFGIGFNYNIIRFEYYQQNFNNFGLTFELNWFYKINHNSNIGYTFLMNYNSDLSNVLNLIGFRYYFR